jgi:phage terminase large subunit
MPTISLPQNWRPRRYQRPLWDYLEKGGKRAAACWHRRAGKDDIGLNRACVSAFERPANYWHMLPEYGQARKAIWEAVDPHTGKKRIDQAFPPELRARTNNNEMYIEFKNGAAWRMVGSDNFDSLVSAGPAGIVFSEWSLSNPRAWGVLSPMLEENGGWALFIYTARGRNHGYTTMELAKNSPHWFAEVLQATETEVFNPEQLQRIRSEYITMDSQNGEALFNQEYLCSFEAAVFGAYWGKEMAQAEITGRICEVPYDEEQLVWTAWDIGVDDSTAIWFYQAYLGGINVIDYYEASGAGVEHYAEVLEAKGYAYANALVPHDARVKEWGSGRTRLEQMVKLKLKPFVVPSHKLMDGISAARLTLPVARFDKEKCALGLACLRDYRAEYDHEKKVLKTAPLHNWASHGADAWRYLSIGWKAARAAEPEKPPPRFSGLTIGNVNPSPWNQAPTVDDIWRHHRSERYE